MDFQQQLSQLSVPELIEIERDLEATHTGGAEELSEYNQAKLDAIRTELARAEGGSRDV